MIHAIGNHEASEAKAPAGGRPAWAEAEDGMHAIAVDPAHPECTFQVGDSLSPDEEATIVKILQDILDVFSCTDSQVAMEHNKSYQAQNSELARYLAAFRKAEAHFQGIRVAGTPRTNIADVDALAKATATNMPLPPHVMYGVLCTPMARATDTLPSTMAAIVTAPD
ncbi:hypothetical protein E2562_021747 [Oryza meyeriana var. granulata]|uniref:Uncharacterized protein n=1 Tax=Oryza meyeriana var. granulata TaxID=110450 RepID=A0A6G1EXX7_9ORYZ|nr:hypothetical protein E2562_021747 [Oryza meyeriana var. granulata]